MPPGSSCTATTAGATSNLLLQASLVIPDRPSRPSAIGHRLFFRTGSRTRFGTCAGARRRVSGAGRHVAAPFGGRRGRAAAGVGLRCELARVRAGSARRCEAAAGGPDSAGGAGGCRLS